MSKITVYTEGMKYVFPVLIALIFLASAQGASAAPIAQKNPLFPVKAFVSSSEMKALGDTVGVYQMVFTLTATGEDVFVPRNAARTGKGPALGNPGVIFDVVESDKGASAKGITGSFLASDAPLVKGFYHIKKGETKTFTLVVAYQNKGIENDEYRTQIGSLRYALRGTDRQTITESNGFAKFKSNELSLVK
jgi:hypothetical protein